MEVSKKYGTVAKHLRKKKGKWTSDGHQQVKINHQKVKKTGVEEISTRWRQQKEKDINFLIMAKKAADDEIPFELGQWVTTEDGYGQVMYVRPFYVEDYETKRNERKNGEFIRYIFVCKILCDLKGKVRRNSRINIYTSISKLDKEGAAFVKDIKANQYDEYAKYIVHDDKVDVCRQVFLDFQVVNKSSLNLEEVEQKLDDIEINLLPAFTFKEFAAECAKQNFPIDLTMLVPYGYAAKKEERITLRFDSYLYKVKGKEAIFHGVRMLADL